MDVKRAKSTNQTGAAARPTNAGDRECQEGCFCLIDRLSYDGKDSELILVVICSRSLAQSFVISLTLALFMQPLGQSQGNKRWSLTSRASYLSSPRDVRKTTTRLLSAV